MAKTPVAMRRSGAALPISLFPVDRLFLLFNILAAAAFASLALYEPRAWSFAGAHVALLGIPVLLARWELDGPRWVSSIRQLYPIAFLPLYWIELGLRHDLLGGRSQDAVIANAELALFGMQPSLVWRAAMPDGWLDTVMQAWYAGYYPLLVGVPLLVLASRCAVSAQELVLRLSLSYLGCFLIYILFPVVGPREFFPAEWIASAVVFAQFTETMRATGDSLGTAFPSSHVAGSITLAWIAWRRCPRALAWAGSLVAAGITAAVVYTGNHYALDAGAAVVLAVGLQRWADRMVGASVSSEADIERDWSPAPAPAGDPIPDPAG